MNDTEKRFWSRVNKTGDCWEWTAGKIGSGYGAFYVDNKQVLAHRWSYENAVGPIPDGKVIDHLCRVRHCVRPDHMEPVTRGENVMRGEGHNAVVARTNLCIRGHQLTDESVWVERNGKRHCKECYYVARKARA